MRRGTKHLLTAALLAGASTAALSEAAEVEAINTATPWRCFLVVTHTPRSKRGPAEPPAAVASPLPSRDWTKADFDDRCWARHQDDLFEIMGGYGSLVEGAESGSGTWPALLCLRTAFGIADPQQVKDLCVTARYIGGAVVYVNGQEVGRGHLPQGPLEPLTMSEELPPEAYTADDGTTPLPYLRWPPAQKWGDRYEKRLRTLKLSIPAGHLVKGRNVLAIELHRAPVAGPFPRSWGTWSHVGVQELRLASEHGAGVIPYAEALRGPHVWSANSVEQVTSAVSPKSLINRGFFHFIQWPRGQPVKGVEQGNPFDPVLPIRMLVPRNGACSGQTVLSAPEGLSGVRVSLGKMSGPNGAALPAEAVRIRYAAQPANLHYCDDLVEAPPANIKTLPVWLLVEAPRTQTPGWYTGQLALQANGQSFTVPVQLLVSPFTVCDSRDFRSTVSLMQSPDTVAEKYGVEPWSEAHFAKLEKSFALLGQLGNDVIYVPVIVPTQMGHRTGLVRWFKKDGGLQPEFSALEKYLDSYLKYCAPPKALVFYVWYEGSSKEVADAYENRNIPVREWTPKQPLQVTLLDPQTGAMSLIPAPYAGTEGSEAFWKPMLEGVRQIVTRRGWSERVVLLGQGADIRPSQNMGRLFRDWAPFARWNLYSHFSADPGSMFYKGTAKEDFKAGRLIAVGDLEVGLKEFPAGGFLTAAALEARSAQPREYLELINGRWTWAEISPPMFYRTFGLQWGEFTRVGLDFWTGLYRGDKVHGSVPTRVSAGGPDGAIPTVRFQMLREGVQDWEAKLTLLEALPKMPKEKQDQCRRLLDELCERAALSNVVLCQAEISLDWPAYVARMYAAAAEAAGVTDTAKWDSAP